MNELLLAEMKRAIELLESNPELERVTEKKEEVLGHYYSFIHLNKDLVELAQLMHLIRKHTVLLEKEIKNKSAYATIKETQ